MGAYYDIITNKHSPVAPYRSKWLPNGRSLLLMIGSPSNKATDGMNNTALKDFVICLFFLDDEPLLRNCSRNSEITVDLYGSKL